MIAEPESAHYDWKAIWITGWNSRDDETRETVQSSETYKGQHSI
jgi:hypothetical protein